MAWKLRIKFISLSSISFLLILFAVFMPFLSLTNFNIGFAYLNAEDFILYFLIGVIICSYFLNGIKVEGSGVFFLFIVIFVLYILSSLLFLGAGFSRTLTLRHAEFYLPFIAAIFLIVSSIKFERDRFEFLIYWSIVCSALTALIIYFFARNWLQGIIGGINEEIGYIVDAGRMYWDGGALALIAIFLFFNNLRVRNKKTAIIGLLIVLAAVLATQNRTLALACVALLFFYLKVGFLSFLYAAIFGAGLYSFFNYLPEYAKDLFLSRFFFTDAGGELYRAFDSGRIPLYTNYFNLIKESPIFGSGLGFPLSYNSTADTYVYISDISIVSFWVPFGLFGLTLIVIFWMRIFYGIKNLRFDVGENYYRNLMFLFFISLFVSFNVDIFSRNIFVLVFVVLIFKLKRVRLASRQ